MFEIYPVEYNNTCVNLNILLLGHSWTSLRGRLIRKYTRCRAFIVIPDSDFCTKNNCSIINDERSSPETLRHCRCTVSGRKTASLLRVIVNKRPVIREVFVNVCPLWFNLWIARDRVTWSRWTKPALVRFLGCFCVARNRGSWSE